MHMAVQLDSTAEYVVEVPLVDVELFRTSSGAEWNCPSAVSNIAHFSLLLLLIIRE